MFRRSLPPVESLFDRYRREAVLLHRPYPLHAGPRTNSQFGGLPRLPVQYEWPRTSNGVPLHFMAQVDCATSRSRRRCPSAACCSSSAAMTTSRFALGWMFGDAGNATFWISPGDLARRDFGKVWATIEGH